MNNKDAFKLLKNMLGDVYIHTDCLKEIADLLKKDLKGKEQQFLNVLSAQLNNVKQFGVKVSDIDGNEILRGLDGHYYSIHLKKTQFNIRLLVYIFDDGSYYLLSAFYERSGKNATSYSKYIKLLPGRLEDMEELENV